MLAPCTSSPIYFPSNNQYGLERNPPTLTAKYAVITFIRYQGLFNTLLYSNSINRSTCCVVASVYMGWGVGGGGGLDSDGCYAHRRSRGAARQTQRHKTESSARYQELSIADVYRGGAGGRRGASDWAGRKWDPDMAARFPGVHISVLTTNQQTIIFSQKGAPRTPWLDRPISF